MANYDATNTNKSRRITKLYRDLDLDFGRHPVTGDVNVLEDADAVKRSVRNIINTSHYERPFHPELGSDIRNLLFENVNPLTAMSIKKKVLECLAIYEPRATVENVIIEPNMDTHTYGIEIYFYVKGIPTQQKIDSFLERLR
tara:strand:+ start:1393 stop:1818 length:426 start_codon:yes stop_codon:yes gene_type:complete